MVCSVGNRLPADGALKMIDGVPVQAALIDAAGRIVVVNEHWQRFACENGFAGADHGLASNHVEICRVVARGLNELLEGRAEEVCLVYPCLSPTEQRWFRLLASRLGDGSGAVILHLNITPEMMAEERAVAGRVAARVAAEKLLMTMKANLRHVAHAELAIIEQASGETGAPGPLILVLQDVGFLAGWKSAAGAMAPAIAAAALTTSVTFLPSLLFSFMCAPYIERLHAMAALGSALGAISAAIVGVVLNLAAYFALPVVFPEDGGINLFAVVLATPTLGVLVRYPIGSHWLVAGGAGFGLVRWLR